MRSLLKETVRHQDADYLEVRAEESVRTLIRFAGPHLDQIGTSVSFGGNVRALSNGGWGFASFNDLASLPAMARAAVQQARLIGAVQREKIRLAPVPVVDAVVGLELDRDPRGVSLERKKQLLEDYNRRILEFGSPIQSSSIFYFDKYTRLYFANSEGTYVEQEKVDLGCNLMAIASTQGQSQQAMAAVGSTRDFDVVRGLGDRVEEVCRSAGEMLQAPSVKGGEYTVILNPDLAGVFIHEAFGHLSEADNVYENPELQKIMVLGTRFGQDHLNVFDTGLEPAARGYLRYDDEGVETEKTYLIKEGTLVGRLHTRETAGKMGERPTGNARAIDYRFPPICRMRNTSIEAGQAGFEDLLHGVKLGVYCKDAYGGQTNGELFTFTAGEAFMIRDGKLAERVKDVTLTGNVFHTLRQIDLVGRDYTAHDSAGGCGKEGQSPLPTSEWSPHVRIQKVVIGGQKE